MKLSSWSHTIVAYGLVVLLGAGGLAEYNHQQRAIGRKDLELRSRAGS